MTLFHVLASNYAKVLVCFVSIYAVLLIVMMGRQRNATNSQIWGN